MKKINFLAALALATSIATAADITGSGASFPFKVYQEWIKEYNASTGIQVDYISKGSSKGIADIKARSVDFAGTDAPLNPNELAEAKLYQFPAVVGAIVMSYNIPGVSGELKLSREAIAAIALGKVQYWDDKVIAESNAGLKLPHEKVTFVHRADGSGTTYNFTYFLSKVSDEWRQTFGVVKSANWPGNQHVGGNKNSGVAGLVKQTPYSVAYIDYADAVGNELSMASVENKEGEFIKPELKAFQTAAAKADLDPKKDFFAVIGDPAGNGAYPIVAATFILLPQEKADTDKKVTAFYDFAFKNGAEATTKLGFVPLPESLTSKISTYWAEKGVK